MHLIPVALLLTAGAAWDVAARRIPNAISGLALVAAMIVQWGQRGFWGVGSGLLAALLLVVLFWVPWAKGRIGGGDVKLGAAAAAALGLAGLPTYLLSSALAGGLVALICVALSGPRARSEMRANLTMALAGRPPLDLPAKPAPGEDRMSVPFGVAFVLGAFATWWIR